MKWNKTQFPSALMATFLLSLCLDKMELCDETEQNVTFFRIMDDDAKDKSHLWLFRKAHVRMKRVRLDIPNLENFYTSISATRNTNSDINVQNNINVSRYQVHGGFGG